MRVRALFDGDDAVSPVVGVILMVAITIILAATAASFVLGFGDQVGETPPQTSVEFDYDPAGNGNLTVTHVGGDPLVPERIAVVSSAPFHPAPGNASGSPSGPSYTELRLDSGVDDGTGTAPWADGDVTAGNGVTIVGASSPSPLDSATVRVVYNSPTSDRTTVVATWEGPSA